MAARMELAEATDADLVRAWRAGSEAAASALVARHAAAIGRFLHASGAPASELDDLVQETLYRAFVKLESWRGEAGFRSWLLAIAANAQRDQYRRHGKRMVIGLDDADLPDNHTPASELACRPRRARGRGRAVRRAARIPVRPRRIRARRTSQGDGGRAARPRGHHEAGVRR